MRARRAGAGNNHWLNEGPNKHPPKAGQCAVSWQTTVSPLDVRSLTGGPWALRTHRQASKILDLGTSTCGRPPSVPSSDPAENKEMPGRGWGGTGGAGGGTSTTLPRQLRGSWCSRRKQHTHQRIVATDISPLGHGLRAHLQGKRTSKGCCSSALSSVKASKHCGG